MRLLYKASKSKLCSAVTGISCIFFVFCAFIAKSDFDFWSRVCFLNLNWIMFINDFPYFFRLKLSYGWDPRNQINKQNFRVLRCTSAKLTKYREVSVLVNSQWLYVFSASMINRLVQSDDFWHEYSLYLSYNICVDRWGS